MTHVALIVIILKYILRFYYLRGVEVLTSEAYVKGIINNNQLTGIR